MVKKVKIFKKLIIIIPALIIILAFFLIIKISISIKNNKVPSIFGYSFSIVGTGSMDPVIKIGDFIIVKDQKKYYEGDIVSFYYDINNDGIKDSVTHQIIKIENDVYTLKGSATLDNDVQIVEEKDIYGKVIHISSILGQVFGLKFLKNRSIIFLGLTLCLAIFAIYQILNIIKIMKENKKPSKS